jgi:hypothetical protein
MSQDDDEETVEHRPERQLADICWPLSNRTVRLRGVHDTTGADEAVDAADQTLLGVTRRQLMHGLVMGGVTGSGLSAIPGQVAAAPIAELKISEGLGVRGTNVFYFISGRRIKRYDRSSDSVTDLFAVPSRARDGSENALAYGSGSLWFADATQDNFDGRIIELDSSTGEQRAEINTGVDITGLTFGGGSLWATDITSNSILEFTPSGNQIDSFDVGGPAETVGPQGLAYSGGRLFLGEGTNNSVHEFSPGGEYQGELNLPDRKYRALAATDTELLGTNAGGDLIRLRQLDGDGPPATGFISGVVSDTEDSGIAGATVELVNSATGTQVTTTTTNSEGRYTVEASTGEYYVTAQSSGKTGRSGDVSVQEDTTTTVDIVLTAQAGEFTIEVDQEEVVQGEDTAATIEGPAGATAIVRINQDDLVDPSSTSATQVFRNTGDVNSRDTNSGFVGVEVDIGDTGSGQTIIDSEFIPGDTTAVVELLDESGPASITDLNPDELSIEDDVDLTVSSKRINIDNAPSNIVIGEDFIVNGTAPEIDRVDLYVRSESAGEVVYEPVQETANNPAFDFVEADDEFEIEADSGLGELAIADTYRVAVVTGFEQISALPGDTISDDQFGDLTSTSFPLRTVDENSIRGQVIDEDNEPIANATVRLPLTDDDITTQTDNQGEFVLDLSGRTTPDPVTVLVEKDGFVVRSINVGVGESVEVEVQPTSEGIVQLSGEIHHLGDGNFDGDINSQFQEPVEGEAWETIFDLSAQQADATDASLVTTIRGAEFENPVFLNGDRIATFDTSDPSGNASELSVNVPSESLTKGSNRIRVQSGVNPDIPSDIDDFEISNIRLRLTLPSLSTFDPTVHGFGFDNYDNPDVDFGEVFSVVQDSLITRLQSLEIHTSTGIVPALAGLVYTGLEGGFTNGHCLGMSFTARDYYNNGLPEIPNYDPPHGRPVQTAADIVDNPETTPTLEPVETDIDLTQNTQGFDSTYLFRYIAVNAGSATGVGSVNHRAVLSAVQQDVKDGTPAPVTLANTIQSGHQVLAYDIEPSAQNGHIDESTLVDVFIYDPNDPAAENQMTFFRSRPGDPFELEYDSPPIGGPTYNQAVYVEDIDPDFQLFRDGETRDGFETALSAGVENFISVGAMSPVELEVTGPDGEPLQRVDANTEALAAETGYDELHFGFGVSPGEYTIQVTGTGSGEYTIEVQGGSGDGGRINDSYTDTIQPNETTQLNATLPEESDNQGEVSPSEDGRGLARFDTNDSGQIEFTEVLSTIAAFNAGDTIGGEAVRFNDVLTVIAAFNTGEDI